MEAPRGGSRWAIAATAFAFFATMAGTTLPTALYSIYAVDLSFSSLTVTELFAVYALGVVVALLTFGRLSDQIGRRPVLLIALACAVVSSALFLLTPSLTILVIARVISGFSAGFMSGAGTAAVIDLFPPEHRGAGGMLAVAANSGGLAAGNLLGGVLASISSSAALVTPFAVHLGMCGLAIVGLWLLTQRPASHGPVRLQIQRLRVPVEIRGAFVRAVLASGAAFAVSGVLTAVTALFLAHDLHIDAHWVPGMIVFLIFAMMAAGQVVAGRVAPEFALLVGCLGLVAAAGFLAIALGWTLLTPLVIAAVVLGLAGGFCVNASLALTVERVQPAKRGEVSSAFFASLYVLLALPATGVGLLATVISLRHAGLVFAGVVAVLILAIGAVQALRVRRVRAALK